MKRKRSLIYDNFLTGINAVLPLLVLLLFLSWLVKIVFSFIQPIVVFLAPQEADQTLSVKLLALFLVLLGITMIGGIIKKPRWRASFKLLENKIFKVLPGYTMVKETMLQILGTKRAPFSQVAIVNIYGNQTRQTAFITEEHQDGSYTVFVPTGPNPTSGNIFHLEAGQVELIGVPYEVAMKTIVACGIDSGAILKQRYADQAGKNRGQRIAL